MAAWKSLQVRVVQKPFLQYDGRKTHANPNQGIFVAPWAIGDDIINISGLTEFNLNIISHHDHQIVENKQTRDAAKGTGVSNDVDS